MKYMGSKNRIAKHILPIILKDRKEGQWYVEPFVGGANIIDKVEGNRIGGESNKYLISMWNEIKNGWVPPSFISEELWRDVKDKMEDKYKEYFISFVRFGCSFGADWNGGYARNVKKTALNAEVLNSTTKSYCRQSKNNILKQAPYLTGVDFVHSSYETLELPPKSIVYCDPPYAGTTKYKDDFDHDKFFDWCREKVKDGHKVFISEYNAPSDFICVWRYEITNSLNNTAKTSKAIEKLFVHESQTCTCKKGSPDCDYCQSKEIV